MKAEIVAIVLASVLAAGCNQKSSSDMPSDSPSAAAPAATPKAATPDNSMTSLDWAGVYSGVVPCADCEGIETTITLNSDRTYLRQTKYLGRDDKVFEQKGAFTWDQDGGKIQLQDAVGGPDRYLVGENALIQLDKDGNRITGEMADKYILRKANAGGASSTTPEALTKPSFWRLTELMGKPVAAPAEGQKPPSLTFEKTGSRVHGFAGCNNFAGQVEFMPGDRIRFSGVAATMMACIDMTIESGFLKALNTADNYNLDGQKLVLNRARMAPLARFEAVP
jgi:heat shock protein HslJ